MAPYSYRGPLEADTAADEAHKHHSQSIGSLDQTTRGRPRVADLVERERVTEIAVAPTDTIWAVVEKMNAGRLSAIVVANPGFGPLGIITDRDIVAGLEVRGFALAALTAQELMTPGIACCRPDDSLDDIARRMLDGGFRNMPVVENGVVVGLLSILDVLRAHMEKTDYETLKLKQAIVG